MDASAKLRANREPGRVRLIRGARRVANASNKSDPVVSDARGTENTAARKIAVPAAMIAPFAIPALVDFCMDEGELYQRLAGRRSEEGCVSRGQAWLKI